jgi:hypothetical protein
MKLHELHMTEMSLQAYNTIGFKKNKKGELNSGGFNKVDRKLVTHPVFKQKLTKFFENTDHPFYIYAIQKSNLVKTFGEYGEMSLEDVEQKISPEIAEMISNYKNEDPDGTHVIFVGNYGADLEMMKPWIMAHRLGHYIYKYNENHNKLKQMADSLFTEVNKVLQDHYRSTYRIISGNKQIFSDDANKLYSALFNQIGTMASARNGKINRPFEFVFELFAQYIRTGKVTLKPFPASIKLTSPSGKVTKQHPAHDEDDEIYASEMESLSEYISEELSHKCEAILSTLYGKIYVG